MFLFSRNVPLIKQNGSRVAFGDIFRIERHTFKVAFDPVETVVGFRIICGKDVKLRPRASDGSDAIAVDDADANSSNGQVSVNNGAPNLNSSVVPGDNPIDSRSDEGVNVSAEADLGSDVSDLENDPMVLA